MLFRLGVLRAVVADVPMRARYGEESSSLVVRSVILEFAWKHFVNTCKRIAYNYYLRNFNIASIEIVFGLLFFVGGMGFGLSRWVAGSASGVATNSGTVMVAALPVIVGVQLILAFLSYDTQNVPKDVLHQRLGPGL
jgi:dolichol-phosphate mannosyltransferase